jgi:probable F420-dependent oxidoreductase
MDFGIGYFPTHDAVGPAALARMIEEHGQESLFVAEHTHTPASRATPYPGGEELPRKYNHTYDPFVALTAAATVTTRLRVGTGICLVNERDPITTAKLVASLDDLSGGRFEFGVGAGWNREEMRNHGTDPRTRMRLVAERVQAMKEIWTNETASYHGEFVDFEEIWQWPKPAQRPHPPVLVGGGGPTVLDRVLAFGDAWFPNCGEVSRDVEERVAELRGRAERPIDVMAMGVPADPAVFERCERLGMTRVVHWLPSNSQGPVESALERWEAAIADHLGSG